MDPLFDDESPDVSEGRGEHAEQPEQPEQAQYFATSWNEEQTRKRRRARVAFRDSILNIDVAKYSSYDEDDLVIEPGEPGNQTDHASSLETSGYWMDVLAAHAEEVEKRKRKKEDGELIEPRWIEFLRRRVAKPLDEKHAIVDRIRRALAAFDVGGSYRSQGQVALHEMYLSASARYIYGELFMRYQVAIMRRNEWTPDDIHQFLLGRGKLDVLEDEVIVFATEPRVSIGWDAAFSGRRFSMHAQK